MIEVNWKKLDDSTWRTRVSISIGLGRAQVRLRRYRATRSNKNPAGSSIACVQNMPKYYLVAGMRVAIDRLWPGRCRATVSLTTQLGTLLFLPVRFCNDPGELDKT